MVGNRMYALLIKEFNFFPILYNFSMDESINSFKRLMNVI